MKRRTSRRLLGLWLALAMVVGLLSGVCAAAEQTPPPSIFSLDKAALTEAIAAVEAYIKTLADNPAYAEIVKTLNTALETAKAMLAKAGITQSELNSALAAIMAALEKARTDVAEASKQSTDQAAAQAVEAIINLLPVNAGVNERVAVAEARALYESLTEAQKKLVSAAALEKLIAAERRIREADDAAAARVSIEACAITVKDQTYTGDVVRPGVRVTYKGVKLRKGKDYKILGYSDNLNIGVATVTVQGLDHYTGVVQQAFRINPKGTSFDKVKGGDGRITLNWKQGEKIAGYQIEIGLKKDLSDASRITVPGAGTLTKTVRGLKSGTTYYVRIRTYAKVDRQTYSSSWSWPKAVKTKGAASNAAPEARPADTDGDSTLDLGEVQLPEPDQPIDEGIVVDGEIELTM